MSKLVYLAGPITGLSYAGSTDWRKLAVEKLEPAQITGLSPMRGKEYLEAIAHISGTGEEYAHFGPLSLPRGVITRDRWDATRCDVLLVNLLGAKSVSIGTMIELGWADAHRIPIVCAIEEKGNPHEHMMVQELIGMRCESLEKALDIVVAMLR